MKVLITADIHIDDYADYNYTYRSRLKQFDKLALRLVEIGKAYKCDEHWILGDIINRPNSRKYIEHAVKRFLKVQSDNFTTVRYILGQHDRESKAQQFDIEDTLITMFDFPNFVYMDKKILELNGRLFGFMNWSPEQDLEWLEDKHLNVLLGHYTKSDLFGQDIDESKFDVMIHGDIHNSQTIGKFISVCNPIQHDFSSEDVGKCIILDTDTFKVERVVLDPDHTRFLQMHYTSDRAEEGFKGELEYLVYKPTISLDNGDVKEKTITWNDIDDLIKSVCKDNQVDDIHSEVEVKCIPYSEVDFNFQLKTLKIHGYRSIKDMEINFDQGDRIAILGDNGSGKSSLIRSLQGIFLRNSYLKYEQSDFTDDLEITLSLVYQNKLFEITKGSRWRFCIDGQEQSYNNLTEFEKDLPVKLPFMNYLDLFFITSNVQNLSNQFNPTRRIELISKFYRLDRIHAYNQTAKQIYDSKLTIYQESKSELDVQYGIQTHIQKRLTELKEFKDLDRSKLVEELKYYGSLREKNHTHQLWSKDRDNLVRQISDIENEINKLSTRLSFDVERGQADLIQLKEKAEKTNTAYEETYKVSIKFESQLKEIQQIENKGSELSAKVSALENSICPECGTPLSKGKSEELLKTYQEELRLLRENWSRLDSELDSYPKKRDSKEYFINLLQNAKSAYNELQSNIELLSNKINSYNIAKAQYDSKVSDHKKLKDRLSSHEASEPEKVKLPLELNQIEFDLNSKIAKLDEIKSNEKELDEVSTKIESINSCIQDLFHTMDKYKTYMELTSMTGYIYEQILRQLSDKFTTQEVKYEVESGVYRGSQFINFNSYYNSKGKYRIYESCSDGQRTICDLDFLSKLFSVNVGLLVLDEYLKHLDDRNFPKACEILKSMNTNTLLVSTHDNSLAVYTKRILLSLDEEGKTQSTIL